MLKSAQWLWSRVKRVPRRIRIEQEPVTSNWSTWSGKWICSPPSWQTSKKRTRSFQTTAMDCSPNSRQSRRRRTTNQSFWYSLSSCKNNTNRRLSACKKNFSRREKTSRTWISCASKSKNSVSKRASTLKTITNTGFASLKARWVRWRISTKT